MNLDNYRKEHATHNLLCSHQYNRNSTVAYYMPCTPIKPMLNDRIKIVVFGDRRRINSNKKRIRYVHISRIFKKETHKV